MFWLALALLAVVLLSADAWRGRAGLSYEELAEQRGRNLASHDDDQ